MTPPLAIGRPLDRSFDQGRVHQRAALDNQAERVELTVRLNKQRRRKAELVDRLTEAPDRRVIRRLDLERQAAEAPERQPVPNRLLRPGVRQRMPLLEKQDLEHRQRRIARRASG